MAADDQIFLKKLNRRTRFTQFLVWIALFFTAVGIAAGYKNWLRIHEKAKASLVGVAQIKSEMPELAKNKTLEQLSSKVDLLSKDGKEIIGDALIELRNIQDSTQHLADTVYTQVESLTQQQSITSHTQAPSVQNWSLSEVHFLLQMGTQALQLRRDKMGALSAFNLADQLLLKKGSVELLPLRKQISNDIALITQYQLPKINLISSIIDDLLIELKPEIIAPKAEKPSATMEKDLATEKLLKKKAGESLVSRVKKTINEAVVVKRFDKPLQEEMDALSKDSLYQLLSIRLETLRLMLLQGRNDNYHKQLTRINSLLKTYYSDVKYSLLKSQINQLQDIELSPRIPNISSSLTMLESLMSESPKTSIEVKLEN